MNKKQVIVISPSQFPGRTGDTANYSEIINQLVIEGFDVLLICPKIVESNNEILDIPKDVKIIRVPYVPPRLNKIKHGFRFYHYLKLLLFLLVESFTVFYVLRQSKIKHVFVRHSILTLQLPIIFKILGVKAIADGELISDSFAGVMPERVLRILRNYEKKIMKFYAYLKVPTYGQAESLQKFGIAIKKILIIPIFVNTERIPKFSIDEIPEHTFGYFGALEKWQGIEILLKGYQLLLKQIPNAKLYIVGEGSLKNELQNFVVKNNLSNVFFATASREVLWHEYFKKFRISIIPRPTQMTSIDSLVPIKLIESLAAGKPTIVTDIPSIREIPDNPVFLFPSGNYQSLAEAMESLSTDYSMLKKYAAKSLATSVNYDIKGNIKKLTSALIGDI